MPTAALCAGACCGGGRSNNVPRGHGVICPIHQQWQLLGESQLEPQDVGRVHPVLGGAAGELHRSTTGETAAVKAATRPAGCRVTGQGWYDRQAIWQPQMQKCEAMHDLAEIQESLTATQAVKASAARHFCNFRKQTHLVRGAPLLGPRCCTCRPLTPCCCSTLCCLCRVAQACVDHRQHPDHALRAVAVPRQLVD